MHAATSGFHGKKWIRWNVQGECAVQKSYNNSTSNTYNIIIVLNHNSSISSHKWRIKQVFCNQNTTYRTICTIPKWYCYNKANTDAQELGGMIIRIMFIRIVLLIFKRLTSKSNTQQLIHYQIHTQIITVQFTDKHRKTSKLTTVR